MLFVLLISVEFVPCLHVVPLVFGYQSAMSCWLYPFQKEKWKFWVTFVVSYTLYARGELGLRARSLSDSCSFAVPARACCFGCRVGVRVEARGRALKA